MCKLHPEATAWNYWRPPDTNLYIALCLSCSEQLVDEGHETEMFNMPYGATKKEH